MIKKIHTLPADPTPLGNKLLFIGDPATGELTKITVDQLKDLLTVLVSPDGAKWVLTIDNNGGISPVPLVPITTTTSTTSTTTTSSSTLSTTTTTTTTSGNQIPVVNAGVNQTITLPTNSVTLTAVASDPDGTIISYLWTKAVGGNANINSTGNATTNVTGLQAGTYTFRCRVTDNQGAQAFDDVQVIVQAAPSTTTTTSTTGGGSTTTTSTTTSGEIPLTGTMFFNGGESGANVATNVFDGNPLTYWDATLASGASIGLDLGTARVINKVKYAPRSPTLNGRLVGGKFQGSNVSFTAGYVDLFTITTAPTHGELTEATVSDPTAYRYVRYLAPANSYANIAEAQFFSLT